MTLMKKTATTSALTSEDNLAFLDELFANLTDNDSINDDTDKIPDLSILDRHTT